MSHTIFLIYITRANALTYSIHIFPYVPRRENRLNIFPSALSFVPLFFITRGNVLLDGSSYGIKFDIYIYIYIFVTFSLFVRFRFRYPESDLFVDRRDFQPFQ